MVTRNCENPSLVLKTPKCKTIVHFSHHSITVSSHPGTVCRSASSAKRRSPILFKSFLFKTYSHLLVTSFDVDMICTWSLHRSCSCHWHGSLKKSCWLSFTFNTYFLHS